MNILVLDVGTSSMRGVLFDGEGHRLLTERAAYAPRSREGRVEQSPADWTEALEGICQRVAGSGRAVDALSLTSQRSSLIPVDSRGAPLRDAIMWQDTRTRAIVEELAARADRIEALTGSRPNTVYLGVKIAWLRRHEPEIYEKACKLCTVADLLTHRITGEFVTDLTYGSRSMLMDLRRGRWDREVLELLGIDETKLCRLILPGSVSGTVTDEFARCTGLPAGIPLISAGGDQQCGALGQGLTGPGRVTVTFGTSGCVLKCAGQVPERLEGSVCGAHAVPGRYVLERSMLTCGAAFEWVRQTLFQGAGFDTMDRAAEASVPGARGVTLLPHFQGRGSPDWNSAARGTILGLELGTRREDIARAALEAIAFETADHLEALDKAGEPVRELRIGGGLTRNRLLGQILADASGKTVLTTGQGSEDTALGAWISAAAALGLAGSFQEAFERAAEPPGRTEPDPRNARVYREARRRMHEAYERLYG